MLTEVTREIYKKDLGLHENRTKNPAKALFESLEKYLSLGPVEFSQLRERREAEILSVPDARLVVRNDMLNVQTCFRSVAELRYVLISSSVELNPLRKTIEAQGYKRVPKELECAYIEKP